MSPVELKICGLRRFEDARLAIEVGARWLGCVVAPDSPRYAREDEVRTIAALCAAEAVQLVIVGRASSQERVRALTASIDEVEAWSQVHGRGVADAPRSISVRRVDDSERVDTSACFADATPERPALLDCGLGGTGRRFDWKQLAPRAPKFSFVAGGVTPENAAELVAYEPWGIDVSSGIEAAPGIKDHDKMRALARAVRGSVVR